MPENCFLINSNGFIKKQDKIPRNEKDLAKARRKDYFARKELEHMSDLQELTQELMKDKEFKKEMWKVIAGE